MRSTVKSSVSLGGSVSNLLLLLRLAQQVVRQENVCLKEDLTSRGWLEIPEDGKGQKRSHGG